FAISREVRGNDMIFIGKHRNQIAEHMRRRRKAVQEHNGGSISGTGFAIEDSQTLYVERAIKNGRRSRSGLGRHRCLLYCSRAARWLGATASITFVSGRVSSAGPAGPNIGCRG